MAIDPILLEVLRNRLDAIADELEPTPITCAASPIVKEGLDASAALFTTHGETIAQAAAIPIHLGALQFAAQRLVRAFPPSLMRDGDAFLLNDPYDGGTHLPDITLAVPVFADGRAVALACTMCHHQDVGGRTPGSVPTDATELYQEGVIIPPTQLFRAGELDENLFRFLTRNVRLPDVFTGDLMAQVAAGRLGGVRLQALFAAHGAPTVMTYIEELLSRAERLTRAQIADIPDGDDQAHRRHDPRRAGARAPRQDTGGELGHPAGDGVRRPRPRHRAALRGERAGRRRYGRAPRQGRHRRHRDRRVELHEHPGRVGGDELPAPDPARAAVARLRRRRALPGRPRARESPRGDDDGGAGLPTRRALPVVAGGRRGRRPVPPL